MWNEPRDPREEIDERLQAQGIADILTKNLREREVFVLVCRFWEGQTYKAIGIRSNVTPERIRQIEKKALRKLRHPAVVELFARLGVLEAEESVKARELEHRCSGPSSQPSIQISQEVGPRPFWVQLDHTWGDRPILSCSIANLHHMRPITKWEYEKWLNELIKESLDAANT